MMPKQDPRVARIVGDAGSVSFLIDRLNEFLAAFVEKTSTDLVDAGTAAAVVDVFLGLEDAWGVTSTAFNEGVKDLDPAEKFLVDTFAPLLDAASLGEAVKSGSPAFESDRPFTNSLAEAYAPFFTRLEAILANTGSSQKQVDLVLGAATAMVLLCSFPLWTVYLDFHGMAAYQRILPRLLDSVAMATSALNDLRAMALAGGPPSAAARLDAVVSQLAVALRQSLIQKSTLYAQQFSSNAEAASRVRTRRKESELNAAVESLQFWKHVSGGDPTVMLAQRPVDPADVAFPYLGGIVFIGSAEMQERSFLALPQGWDALAQATRFVSQSGFWLRLNAANNPYCGRHQPHKNSHENGGDFDLAWTYVATDAKGAALSTSLRENVARMTKVKPADGKLPVFTDPVKNVSFNLVPVPEDRDKPPTHAQIQKLAAHIVLQAVALSGLRRYLYADAQNMAHAANSLGLAMSYLAKRRLGLSDLDPKLDPWAFSKRAVIPFVEPTGHYNHLHAELFAVGASDPGPLLKERLADTLTFLYELALERDQDDQFYEEMFQPRSGVQQDESEAKIGPFRDAWKQRSKDGLPSLLPVWLTAARWKEFMNF
jgi:hypothetical protein